MSEQPKPKSTFKQRKFEQIPMFCNFVPIEPLSDQSGIYYVFKKIGRTTGECLFIMGRKDEFPLDAPVIWVEI